MEICYPFYHNLIYCTFIMLIFTLYIFIWRSTPVPGHPAGALLHGGNVRGEGVHAEVPHRAAPEPVVDVGQPQRLQRQLREPDLEGNKRVRLDSFLLVNVKMC